ncbi:MAG: VWA domain-containing protein [Halieaceae bacterium]|jgi:type IV pilus assembly protein PilY1|nr:VWA domain-containing protein [Halieaceae bacterium]
MKTITSTMLARIGHSWNDTCAPRLAREGRRFAAAFLSGLVAVAPVWADDTEIFFGDTTSGGVAPNLLLIVDTSGSMSNTVRGTGKTRLQNVQDALHTLLNSLNNVNVGLMRFSNPGGPVIYQVDNLDRNVNEVTGIVTTTSTVVNRDDDAQQGIRINGSGKLGVGSLGIGDMFIDNDRLTMSRTVVGAADVFEDQISTRNNDAEEQTWITSGDGIYVGSSDLEFLYENGNSSRRQTIGLRFDGTTVPDGATITNAYITFRVDESSTGGTAEITITGEYGESEEFQDNTAGTITSRDRTDASVEWDLSDPAGAEFVVTPSLTSIVQDIVDHPDWRGDGSNISDMAFIFERRAGSTTVSTHVMESYDKSGGFAPQLTVEYYVGTPPEEQNTITGLRFSNVDIPRGVTITNASIDFVVAQTNSTETTNMVIVGERNANPLPYSDANTIFSRNFTLASANWSDIPVWNTNDETQSTTDISNVVQEIVNMSDWCGGNPMAFALYGTGLRSAWARDADNGLQPVLNISYDSATIEPGNSCTNATISMQITDSDDDVEEEGSNVWVNSSDLDFQNNRNTGLRFPGINIPQGAQIQSAYIEFSSWWNYSGNTTIRVEHEQTDDSADFNNSNGTVDSRNWSGAIDWNITDNWSEYEWVRTADIGSHVQSIVDRGGWSTGNAMAFRVYKSSGTTRRAISHNYDPVYAPRLVINFQDDGTQAADVRLVREEILEQVDQLNTRGLTPIQDTLYEAALYYTGGEVDYGRYRGGPNDSGPHSYTRVSVNGSLVPGTYQNNYPSGCSPDNLGDGDCRRETLEPLGGNNPTYSSPIVDWCQKESHIILLTDGLANRPHSESKIKSFVGDNTCDTSVRSSEACVKELVNYLYTTDQSDLREEQIIRTHTIGFNFSSQWLADVAEAGGGQYKEATQASDLVAEVQSILTDVLKVNSTFVAPVAAINQFNRLNHRSEIYFAVFRPEETPNWPGNLKKYRLGGDDNTILDYATTEGEPAINPATGFFSDNAVSAWGGVTDGAEVEVSGANGETPNFDQRSLYTYYSGSTSDTLSNAVNRLSPDNTALTKAMFNATAMSNAEFAEHIEWVMGKDVDDEDGNGVTNENRYIIGDPLHSKPVAVTYGGSEADPDITVFFGSNSGFLHAVNAATGVEEFAFIPEDTLGNQTILRESSTNQSHVYGIDGSVTAWVNDENGNGEIAGDGEFVRIYFGQRRGGRNYYAIDVTDRDNPQVMWTIRGGTGDFAELGQTWSRPVRGAIDVGGIERDVIYFTGGYDPDQDDSDTRVTDDMGRALYIVDALSGELIWSGGPNNTYTEEFADMLYSFPADLAVVDITSSGTDNMIFVGDTGGQVWRFDITNGAEIDNLITGGVIGDLGVADDPNTMENNRRFYHSPDVALVIKNGEQKLAVTIGSGFQAGPLSVGTADRFYMLLQDEVYTIPETYVAITHDELYDASDNDVGEGVDGAVELLDAAQGYYFNTPNDGEKILSTPLIFNNAVTFTTYEPNPTQQTSRCIPAAGVTRVYQIALLDAAPINDWDDVEGLTEADRGAELKTTSIIDEPVIICTGAGCDMYVGPEQPPSELLTEDRVYKTFWRKD